MDSEDDSDLTDQSVALTGFLFGNINKAGHLEDDVLDEVIYYSTSKTLSEPE